MLITHLFNESRAAFAIMQGLLTSTKNVEININYISKGEIVKKKSNDIFANLKMSNIIFMNDIDFFHDFFDKNQLWNKIFYDYKDTTKIVETIPKSVVYFKRSLYLGNNRTPIFYDRTIYPIFHCPLNEYFTYSFAPKYDIGCFFDINNNNLGVRRKNTLTQLMAANFENSLIGISTGYANKARLAIREKVINNSFYEFLKLQSQCKIIFTAQPEPVEGDNRLWEALSSGALVFCEKPIGLSPNLIDGEHCIFFNSLQKESIDNSIEKAKYYLKNESERLKIAQAGLNFIKKHHMPLNRIKTMMSKLEIKLI